MDNSIDLGLQENLHMDTGSDSTKKMGEEPLGFITDQAEGRNIPNNTKFMAT